MLPGELCAEAVARGPPPAHNVDRGDRGFKGTRETENACDLEWEGHSGGIPSGDHRSVVEWSRPQVCIFMWNSQIL